VSPVLLFLGAAFALGGAVILAAMLRPAWRATALMLWRFYLSEFLIVGGFLLPAALGGWVFLLLLLVLAARGQWELQDLYGWRLRAQVPLAAIAAGTALIVLAALAPAHLPAALTLGLVVLAAAGLFLRRRFGAAAMAPAASLVFPVMPLVAMALLRPEANGFLWLFLAQAVVETNDAFALLIGKLAGRRKILPRLSPGKTLEGLIAGLLAGGAAGFVIAHYLIGLEAFAAVLVTLIVLVAGNAGDLLLSALKRARGVKDFRPVAALHGGLLDIYDSLLFAVPAILLARALL
jgi:phosphatidate cytidylyltransferase